MALTLTSDIVNSSKFVAGASASVTATLPTVNAGDFIKVWVTIADNPAVNTITVSDPTNGTYTAGQKVYVSGDTQGVQQFWKKNSAASPGLITASFASAFWVGLYAEAWGGADTTTGLDTGKEQGQSQVAPGTGANAVVSGGSGLTPTQTDLFLGSCMDTTGESTHQTIGSNVAWGTNTNGDNRAAMAALFEKFTSGSQLAATYTGTTDGATHSYATMLMCVLPAAAGGATSTPYQPWSQLAPLLAQ